MPPDHTPHQQSEVSGAQEDEHFRTDRLTLDLGGRTARGGAVTLVSQGVQLLLSIGTTIVLGRLLTPQDYGLIGMVVAVVGFVAMFKDLGLSEATIQRKEITAAQISSLFWINVALSVAVMLLTAFLAPAVARFYGDPRLTLVTIVYATGFVFAGLTVQHEALLRRQMRFIALAVTDILSLLASIAAAIVLAWHGAHYWALVASQLVSGFTNAVAVWLVCRWRPSRPAPGSGIGPMLTFGRNLTGFSIVNYFARNLDNMLIGKFWGSQQLGLYARAYQLLLLPLDQINSPIAAVAVPALSRLTDSPERYRQAYLRTIEKIAMLTMPSMAVLIATSDWVVRLVLGPQWSEAARIFTLLGIVGLVQPISSTTGWLFITQARTHHMFQWGLIGGSIILLSIIVGLPWGAAGVALSYSLVGLCIITPLLFWFVGRVGPVRTSDFYYTIAPAACAAMSVLLALLLFRRSQAIIDPATGLVVAVGIAVGITLVVLSALPAGRMALQDARRLIVLVATRDRVRSIA
jgi:PST family polysaccharide transporter